VLQLCCSRALQCVAIVVWREASPTFDVVCCTCVAFCHAVFCSSCAERGEQSHSTLISCVAVVLRSRVAVYCSRVAVARCSVLQLLCEEKCLSPSAWFVADVLQLFSVGAWREESLSFSTYSIVYRSPLCNRRSTLALVPM